MHRITVDGWLDLALWVALLVLPALHAHGAGGAAGTGAALAALVTWVAWVPIFRGIGRFYGGLALSLHLVWRLGTWLV